MSLNGGIKLPLLTANPAESPAEGFIFAYVVGTSVRYKDASGNVYTLSTGITAEEVEDIIGNILQDSDSIDFTYDDEGNAIRAIVKQAGIIHDQITGHGTNSHATIDAHLAATDNPHATTKGQVGLGNCDNTSDVNKPISSATQTALNAKEPTVAAGTTGQYYRGDKSWQTLDKTAVGLANVDNTSDVNKPISNATQTALNAKEPTITAGTTSQYYRGDKSWQALDIAAVTGLTAALAGKEPTVSAGTTSQYYRGDKSWQTHNFASLSDYSGSPNATGQFIYYSTADQRYHCTTGGWSFDVASSPSNGQLLQWSLVGSSWTTVAAPTTNGQALIWNAGYGTGFWQATTLTASYISDFNTAAQSALAASLALKADASLIGSANGIAPLGADSKVPAAYLPSYVDDVLEYANTGLFPATGEAGKIYTALDTNKIYRWSGTVYTEISQSLALGETSSTAYRGDRGKIAYDHSQTTGNPHSTSKGDVGLGNCDNTSDVNKPISSATQTALNAKEPTVAAGTTGQYYRGDKSWQTLDKTAVGLANVDNTSDVNKPISSATQTALNAKVDDSQVGAANGVASLDSSGKVPTAQLPSSFGGDTNAVLASDTNNSSSSTFVTLTNMGFSAVSGKIYRFEAMLRFKTAASSTGMGVTMNTSDTAVGDMCALVDIPSANDGPGAVYHGSVSSLGDVVTSTAVQASNTYFLARIKGIFVCTTGGTIVPLFRSEVNGSQVTIGAGSVTTWREIA